MIGDEARERLANWHRAHDYWRRVYFVLGTLNVAATGVAAIVGLPVLWTQILAGAAARPGEPTAQ